jgi:hypothetical protein
LPAGGLENFGGGRPPPGRYPAKTVAEKNADREMCEWRGYEREVMVLGLGVGRARRGFDGPGR